MKKETSLSWLILSVLFLLFCFTPSVCAFNYTISFTATGAATTVESVLVRNLTLNTTVIVPAGNVLNLTDVMAVSSPNASDENIRFYSQANGITGLTFYSKQAGLTQLNAFGIDGRKIAGIYQFLSEGRNSFQLSLTRGVYIIQVTGNGYSYATKMISKSVIPGNASIVFIGNEKPVASVPQKIKSGGGITTMLCGPGEKLLLKAVSGNYTTILMDSPYDHTVNFNFVACQDANQNNYATVNIGTQTWMAENLRATKYRNADLIPGITNNAAWIALTTGGWRDYNNDTSNGTKYGHLYNWYAVSNPLNIAPVGWHVPTNAEWKQLADFLGGDTIAGDKLKSTTDWYSNTPGVTNETAFTALPGGNCDGTGAFNAIGRTGSWWTASQSSNIQASDCVLNYDSARISKTSSNFINGFSVRCVQDVSIPVVSTYPVTNIYETSAQSGGTVNSYGGTSLTDFGICWSISPNPTVADNMVHYGPNETGPTVDYNSSLKGLTGVTTYYIRAFATNSAGTGYGNQVVFTTLPFVQDITFQKMYSTLGLTGNQQPAGDGDVANMDEVTTSFVRQIWNLNELSTDEAMCAWGDTGLPELNFNQWTTTLDQAKGLYKRLYFNISVCNHFLIKTAVFSDANTHRQRAEARFLRVLNYYYLLDMFGNVPFTESETLPVTTPQIQRANLFNYLNKELAACESTMYSPKASDKTYYRVDVTANWLLRSRLYLNAEVYTGTARWDSAAIYSKKVIDSGYTLCPVFRQLFMADNAGTVDGSTVNKAPNEIIFPVYCDGVNATSWGSSLFLIASTRTNGMVNWGSNAGWSGNRARAALVKKFFPTGSTFFTDASDLTTAILASMKDARALFDKKSVSSSLDITTTSNFREGYQVIKYTNVRADGGTTSDPQFVDMDIPLMRAAEAYLNYAEAVTRGASAIFGYAAVDAVNALRTRAGAPVFSTLTLQNIIDERAREFFFEGYRRTDLIRFGQFGGSSSYVWDWKGGVAAGTNFNPYRNVFPIPQSEIDANSNLIQNPGY